MLVVAQNLEKDFLEILITAEKRLYQLRILTLNDIVENKVNFEMENIINRVLVVEIENELPYL